MGWYGFKPYVSVAERRVRALKKMEKLRKKGLDIKPVEIEGRKIVRTFWGEAWCEHLESFSDYENRLPRGRTYVRNGSVCHLDIEQGAVTAMVSGSELYTVNIAVKTLARNKWKDVKNRCAGQIGSLLELLDGRLSENVMAVVTHREKGLFPIPGEIQLKCSCPDWAVMCKHVAAVLYGVGARLDETPELLFRLRGVDHEELISADVEAVVSAAGTKTGRLRIADDALADVFGIEMSENETPAGKKKTASRKKAAAKETIPAKIPMKKKKTDKNSPVRKTVKNSKTSAKTKAASQTADVSAAVTGRDIAVLRAKFGMSQSEFAQLLGVSVPSVGNWEKKPGPLVFQARSLAAWKTVKKMSKKKAWQKLGD